MSEKSQALPPAEFQMIDHDSLYQGLLARNPGLDPAVAEAIVTAMSQSGAAVARATVGMWSGVRAFDTQVTVFPGQGYAQGYSPVGARPDEGLFDAALEQEVETLTGRPLPAAVAPEETLRRLSPLMRARDMESWAGPVLGPSAAAEFLGIGRSTLDAWRKEGKIIALPKGKRAHVIPMAQFPDGRPMPGLDGVLAAAGGNAGVAWEWLCQPHLDFGDRPPLEALRVGAVAMVTTAARRSLG
ncbi:helix-turn-helix domain-containing protein [Salipiger sp. P9]|uniref:antitoxin Xre/MbcA/ParS-like domain-containing protein n=1 Tax=Salipiger pentaromativorans TaxID=2943193 RepID=UPI002157CEB7|nr:helix-turn-helix domain-containing protein [Salipiger pentaromativorans]MCR8550198.1 helix-turn-helix domain-containing protein [Salipiger pentaromativorans]